MEPDALAARLMAGSDGFVGAAFPAVVLVLLGECCLSLVWFSWPAPLRLLDGGCMGCMQLELWWKLYGVWLAS
ncbi:MAG: hypothetical protein DRN96_07185 [Thermoproteota archaeon]|nr:MAG: hypothetical protein DRN96_07185 [Candidatus Korarchaeota archaeon]